MKLDALEKVLATLKAGDGLDDSIYLARFDKVVRLALDTAINAFGKRCIETFFNWIFQSSPTSALSVQGG